MALSSSPDPRFITCDVEGHRFSNQEWLEVDGIRLRTPRLALSAALILVGLPDGTRADLLDHAMSWVMTVEKHEGSAQSNQPLRILKRLGAASDQTLFVGMPGHWGQAASMWSSSPGSYVVFIASPAQFSSTSFPGPLSAESDEARIYLDVKNRQALRSRATFLLPDSSVVDQSSISTVLYRAQDVAPHLAGGYRKLFLALSGAVASLSGGGNPARYFEATLSGGHNPPFGGWLASLPGSSNEIERMTGIRVSLGELGLSVFGYDVRQSRPASGWHARDHSLVLTGSSSSFESSTRLGALRREVLDTIGTNFSGITQAYGAFALPGGDPMDLAPLPNDTYGVRILDENGENIATNDRVLIRQADWSNGTHYYELLLKEGSLVLVKAPRTVAV